MATDDVPEHFLAQARAIALELPEATEIETWGHPTFRVRNKIFAGIGASDGQGSTSFAPDEVDGRMITMTMKAAAGEQESLLASGAPFFRPRYVGQRGWIGIVIDDETDWAEVEELVLDSYCAIAPKTLAKQLLAE